MKRVKKKLRIVIIYLCKIYKNYFWHLKVKIKVNWTNKHLLRRSLIFTLARPDKKLSPFGLILENFVKWIQLGSIGGNKNLQCRDSPLKYIYSHYIEEFNIYQTSTPLSPVTALHEGNLISVYLVYTYRIVPMKASLHKKS